MAELKQIKSFKVKLMLLITSITFIALLLASIGLSYLLVSNYQTHLHDNAKNRLEILAFNMAPALIFDDNDAVEQLLSSFKTSKDVELAIVFKANRERDIVANYARSDYQALKQENYTQYLTPIYDDNYFKLTMPIIFEEETIGFIYQQSNFDQLTQFKQQLIVIVIIVFIVCLSLGVVIAYRFQRVLLNPLFRLVDFTRDVIKSKDYSLRVSQVSKDEFSILSRSVNLMLDEIETHTLKQQEIENEIRVLNQELENKVKDRTLLLEKTNIDLQDTVDELVLSQKKLIEQEKMASLGALVAGVAHEINTPVGVSLTSISYLNELTKELSVKFENKHISQSYLANYITHAIESTDISIHNLTRAGELINSFKQIAVDQSSDEARSIVLVDYLNEILYSLKPQLKKKQHQISVECDKSINLYCRVGALAQVITNLVMNSYIHGFEGIEQGKITLTAQQQNSRVTIDYRDNGIGMTPANLAKLFEPFYTTKRGQGGSGLGAHLVYNLVTQALKGSISVKSEFGQGLHFTITLPVSS
ncbi:HAMP domain-containing sensor histidine kinase [Thalassotalea ganghwensis]